MTTNKCVTFISILDNMEIEKKQEQTISFHNTPSFYLAYTENWLLQKKSNKANATEIAIVEDIHKLVKIAVSVLTPEPAEPETDK